MGQFRRFKQRIVSAIQLKKITVKGITFWWYLLNLIAIMLLSYFISTLVKKLSNRTYYKSMLHTSYFLSDLLGAVFMKIFSPKKSISFSGLMTISLFGNFYLPFLSVFLLFDLNVERFFYIVYIVSSSFYYRNNLKPRGYKGFRLFFIILIRAIYLLLCWSSSGKIDEYVNYVNSRVKAYS